MLRPPLPVVASVVGFAALLAVSVGADDIAGGAVFPSTRTESTHHSSNPSVPASGSDSRPQGESGEVQEKESAQSRNEPSASSGVSVPESTPKAPTEAPEPSSSTSERSPVRKGLDKMIPGVEQLPDWAIPIVARAQEHAAPGTTVQASIDDQGRLVASGEVEIKDEMGIAGLRLISLEDGEVKRVEITAIVEDPTEATVEDPAHVEVTVTNPETEETVTGEAEITSPEEAADVTEQITAETVESSRAEDVLTEESA